MGSIERDDIFRRLEAGRPVLFGSEWATKTAICRRFGCLVLQPCAQIGVFKKVCLIKCDSLAWVYQGKPNEIDHNVAREKQSFSGFYTRCSLHLLREITKLCTAWGSQRHMTIQRESIKKLCMYICRYMQCIYDITHVL